MKICYLANAGSIHTQRWAQHFEHRGHQVMVISFQPGAIDKIGVVQLGTISSQRRLNILLNLGRVRSLVRKIAPDILHAHYATSYGLCGALAGRHPLVITAWGTDVLIEPEQSWVYRQMVRFALSRADLVTTSARHVTQHIIGKGYAAANKSVTLPFGVDTEVFNPSQRTRPHGNEPALVVSTRRLDAGLEVDTFIRAIPKVFNAFSGVRFLVVGDGLLRPQLERLAADLGVAKRIEFRGHISQHEMTRLLGRADVFVSTSPSDANHVSLNEAMACGAFPVVTDITANRAWIRHGQTGLTFPPGDADQLAVAIIEALKRPEWRQGVMAQNWAIVCAKASWSHSMAEMERYYGQLLPCSYKVKDFS